MKKLLKLTQPTKHLMAERSDMFAMSCLFFRNPFPVCETSQQTATLLCYTTCWCHAEFDLVVLMPTFNAQYCL